MKNIKFKRKIERIVTFLWGIGIMVSVYLNGNWIIFPIAAAIYFMADGLLDLGAKN